MLATRIMGSPSAAVASRLGPSPPRRTIGSRSSPRARMPGSSAATRDIGSPRAATERSVGSRPPTAFIAGPRPSRPLSAGTMLAVVAVDSFTYSVLVVIAAELLLMASVLSRRPIWRFVIIEQRALAAASRNRNTIVARLIGIQILTKRLGLRAQAPGQHKAPGTRHQALPKYGRIRLALVHGCGVWFNGATPAAGVLARFPM